MSNPITNTLSGENNLFFDLSDRARFRFSGEDRERFLQGQVSNDVLQATPEKSIYCAVMSSKGKMNGDGYIYNPGDFLGFDTESHLRQSLQERFEKFIIADDVELHDVTAETCQYHLLITADQAAQLSLPLVESNRIGIDGYDLFLPSSQRAAIFDQLCAQFIEGDRALYEVIRIEHGIAAYGADMGEDTIPNEAGLEARAISYHKGCYIGQEVISRIKSVGRVNWTWSGFIIDAPAPFQGEIKIFQGEKEVGEITSSCHSPRLNEIISLGYLRREFAKTGETYITDTGIQATVTPLPFVKNHL